MLEQLLVSSTSKTELSICFVKRRGASVVQTAPLLAWDSGVPRSYIGWRNSVSMHVNFGVVPAVKSLMCDEFAIPTNLSVSSAPPTIWCAALPTPLRLGSQNLNSAHDCCTGQHSH